MSMTHRDKSWAAPIVGLALIGLLVGCDKLQDSEFAQKMGGIAGKVVGHNIGQALGLSGIDTLGAQAGFLLGGELAASLTEAEQRKALEAEIKTLDSGRVGSTSLVTWKSDENAGVGCSSQVVREYTRADGQLCRATSTSARGPRGEDITRRQDWCKQADGNWLPVA